MYDSMNSLDDPADAGPSIEEIVSVRNHEAFAAKHMPDLGQDIKDFQVFTWRLDSWKNLDKKLTSPDFECGGHKWRILLFPFGNSNASPNDTVSVYLEYAEPKKGPEGWHACVQFALVISNIHDPTVFTVSHAHHRFIAEECDWGFTRFCDLHKLFDPQHDQLRITIEGDTAITDSPNLSNSKNDQLRPTIEGDTADVSVFVRVLDDPTGVLWRNLVEYDTKKETGYVGLKPQGETSCLNSLIQALYCTRNFRKALYQIPTEKDLPAESVALALQRVFHHLKTSDRSVGTDELAESCRWEGIDSLLPYDVQEFKRALLDKIEPKIQGTKPIAEPFIGIMRSHITCVNVEHESSRSEEFKDIQLNVKGMRNLYESLKDYVAVESLNGDNQYDAGEFGLQDATRSIIFESFPPVLHLQLKRFTYDDEGDAMVKIHDRHEYPFEINLAEFLYVDADRSKPWNYKLAGVLVHSGDLHGGHYFALIKPDNGTRWLKFDDERVTPVTDREVLEENYGGEPLNGLPPAAQRNQVRAMKRLTNAYMLVYIRESAMDEIWAPFTEDDTPPHLKRRLDEERLQIDAKKREREEQHLFLTAKVITDETFSRHEGFDLATFDEKNWPPSDLPNFRVLKQETYSVFKSRVARHFNYPENQIRLWVLVNRQNKTVRPDTAIPENEPKLTVEVIRNNIAARQNDLRLYLDVIKDSTKAEPSAQSIMVFLKHFDTTKQNLLGIGKTYMQRTSKVGDLVPLINERMRWTPGSWLKLYEEVHPGRIDLLNPEISFAQSEIQDGDVICFHQELTEEAIRDLGKWGLHSDPIQFSHSILNAQSICCLSEQSEAQPAENGDR